MIEKMIRAARLDPSLYNQVERDETETTNALIIVLVVAVIGGISIALATASLGAATRGSGATAVVPNPLGAFVSSVLSAVLGWFAWSFIIYLVGTRLFNATATPGELLRTLGYAQSPGVLNIVQVIPCLGQLIGLGVAIWTLVTSFIATREALDLDNGKTAITVILSFIANIVIAVILGTILGIGAFGLSALTGGLGR